MQTVNNKMNNVMNEKLYDKIKDNIKFDSNGLVPVITQDADTAEVLMLAYANLEALEKTITNGQAHYYSRSRKELWHKGATSGNVQHIVDIRRDCDSDAILYTVRQEGFACHTGNNSCFYRSGEFLPEQTSKELPHAASFSLANLQHIIADRKANPVEGSYTNYLFEKGLDKILKKIGEESAEVIIASKNCKKEVVYECADLLYHLTVLLAELGLEWPDILSELKARESSTIMQSK